MANQYNEELLQMLDQAGYRVKAKVPPRRKARPKPVRIRPAAPKQTEGGYYNPPRTEQPQPQAANPQAAPSEPSPKAPATLGQYGAGTHESDIDAPSVDYKSKGWEKDFLGRLEKAGLPWLAKNPTVVLEPNLHPLYAWSDQMFGTKYSPGYQRPKGLVDQVGGIIDLSSKYRDARTSEKRAENESRIKLLNALINKQYADSSLAAGAIGKSGNTVAGVLGGFENQRAKLETDRLTLEMRIRLGERGLDDRLKYINSQIGLIDQKIRRESLESDRIEKDLPPVPKAPKSTEPKPRKPLSTTERKNIVIQSMGNTSGYKATSKDPKIHAAQIDTYLAEQEKLMEADGLTDAEIRSNLSKLGKAYADHLKKSL